MLESGIHSFDIKKRSDYHFRYRSRFIAPLIAACLSAVIFFCIYGFRIIDPCFTDWMLKPYQDATQHYLGWIAYRNSDWTFPYGLTDHLMYPFKTSIIFTDSIPLMAVFFKILSPILPSDFHYFGIWGLLCYVLTSFLACLLLEETTRNRFISVAGSLFLAFSYQIIIRSFVHSSLAGQWLLLLALGTIIMYHHLSTRRAILSWILIGLLSTSVHIYFLLMNGIILLGFITKDIIHTCLTDRQSSTSYASSAEIPTDSVHACHTRKWYRNPNWLRPFIFLACYTLSALTNLYLLGAFYTMNGYEAGSFDLYSLNINSLINNREFGFFPNSFPVSTLQKDTLENHIYLGVGILFLLLIALFGVILHIWRDGIRKVLSSGLPYLIPALTAFIFALSPNIFLGNRNIFSWEPPTPIARIWSVFRATGRISFVTSFIIMLFAITYATYSVRYLAGYIKKKTKTAAGIALTLIFASAIIFQSLDLYILFSRRLPGINIETPFVSSLDTKALAEFTKVNEIEHFTILPQWSDELYDIAIFATTNNITLNNFAFSRAENLAGMIKDRAIEDLYTKDPHTAYIFSRADCMTYPDGLYYYDLGVFILGSTCLSDRLPLIEDISQFRYYSYSGRSYYLSGADYDAELDCRILYPGGISFGPYIDMLPGRYIITATGSGLDRTDIRAQFMNRDGIINICDNVEIEATDEYFELILNVTEYSEKFEIVITNNSDEDVIISEIEIRETSF